MTAATRREFLAAGGLLVLFAIDGAAAAPEGAKLKAGGPPPPIAPGLPGSLAQNPWLDAWVHVAPDGRVTVFTGKAELGQGIRTALHQLAVDELDMAADAVTLVTADTARGPMEGLTAGSHSMQDSGAAIVNACVNVRLLLAEEAARRWSLPADALRTRRGQIFAPDGRSLGYGPLAAGLDLHVWARPGLRRKAVENRRVIGRNVPRLDIPAKLTGGAAYLQDMVLPGMLHARVVRGPAHGTMLAKPDIAKLAALPGVVRVVQNGLFVALLGTREWPLVQALRVAGTLPWAASSKTFAAPMPAALPAAASEAVTILSRRGNAAPGIRKLAARYTRPYLLHGSIGPSCAVALFRGGRMTVWTHSQGVSPLRGALAGLLALPPDRIRCIHVEGAGCYGHNGADDVAGDAALCALAVPGRPVKLGWSREQEHGWEPLGPAMTTDLTATLDATGRIADFRLDVWSNSHATRPAQGGDLLAGTELDPPLPASPPFWVPQPEGGGDRNAIPLYALSNATVVHHKVSAMPQRVSALRALGGHLNVFAIESFIDELAQAAGVDPVAFRLRHLDDPRARTVIERAAAQFGWASYARTAGRNAGFAFARYKNLGAYCAIALDIEVESDTGRYIVHRATAAVDAGEAVSPDGIRNQIEGGIVQSLSWTGLEAVTVVDGIRRSFDWSTYPILRFDDVPRRVDVDIIDQPGAPFLGVGEAAQGPVAAALANAIAAATGRRLRDMPLRPALLASK